MSSPENVSNPKWQRFLHSMIQKIQNLCVHPAMQCSLGTESVNHIGDNPWLNAVMMLQAM